MKIALLEDEMMLRSSIEEYLKSLNHRVSSFSSGKKAVKTILGESFDLLIFDINVPKLNGFEVLEQLRENRVFIPVIYISALVNIEEITKAYELGAADYIKKPFHLKELALRINRVAKSMEDKKREHILLSQNHSFSKSKNQLFYAEEPLELTKKQLDIIKTLCLNIDHTVSFDKLRDMVWSAEPVDNATIRAEISRLRKALKEDFIESVKGVGYKITRYTPV
ncbi:MAG: response regulator transcription factor [Epsilonproteobacteria bacterium]|nr:response regulator transcription factor [Campylobacterota bacterium]